METSQNKIIISDTEGASFTFNFPSSQSTNRSFFIFSHPKAGSTLLDNIMEELCISSQIPTINLPNTAFRFGINQRLLTSSIDNAFFKVGYAYLGWRLFPVETNIKINEYKSIYLIRDPRDMITSLYFSRSKSHEIPKSGSEKKVLLADRRLSENYEINEWVKMPSAYKFYLNQFSRYLRKLSFSNTRIYRYEDVIFKKQKWLEDITSFLELEVGTDIIKTVSSKFDIIPNEEDPNNHVRQVKPGNHTKHLNDDSIDFLNDQFSEVLSLYEYTRENSNTEISFNNRFNLSSEQILDIAANIKSKL